MSIKFAPGTRRPRALLPSANFLFLTALFAGSGVALWQGLATGRFVVFVFVVSGWVVSLCLHEFGHAVVAYAGGDLAIADTGYLSLDPMRYTDPVLSLVLPLVYILIGGFGLPGGAVYIRTGRLRSRLWMSAVSLAGPAMNLAFLLALAALYAVLPLSAATIDLASGLGVLALFQATAILLNLLPLPGLDGFGIIRPYLPPAFAARANQIGGAAFLVLFLLLFLTPAGRVLIGLGLDVTGGLGIAAGAVARGFGMLRLL